MVQEWFVDCNWVQGVGKGGKPGGLCWGDQLFGCSDVVWGGFYKEVRPISGFCSVDRLEIAELRLSCYVVGVGGLSFLGSPGGFRELLPESGQERGPPRFGSWGRARQRRSGFNRHCECGEDGEKPLVTQIPCLFFFLFFFFMCFVLFVI